MATMKMLKTMRWYGPHDSVSLADIHQAGVEGIVTALHDIPVGEVWPVEAIQKRQNILQKKGLVWAVVESLPVHEDIKKGNGQYQKYIENYKQSLQNLASCGIYVITYNFMPILDWIRTNHNFENPDGTQTLAYNHRAFSFFDLELLQRPGAENDYTTEQIAAAKAYGQELSAQEQNALFQRILTALPGSDEDFTPELLLSLLDSYGQIDANKLRENLIHFLSEVIPVAENVGCKMAIHPDDPPFPLLGLPRIMSTAEDARKTFETVPSQANGLCYCTGSFGAQPSNNLLQIIDEFGNRIHFLHLRNVLKSNNGDFRESGHLEGDNDMLAIIEKLVMLMEERGERLPMRPDHGFLHALEAGTPHYPGYSLIGRLKGLAELRGVELAVLAQLKKSETIY